jgi:hypothetical protein
MHLEVHGVEFENILSTNNNNNIKKLALREFFQFFGSHTEVSSHALSVFAMPWRHDECLNRIGKEILTALFYNSAHFNHLVNKRTTIFHSEHK